MHDTFLFLIALFIFLFLCFGPLILLFVAPCRFFFDEFSTQILAVKCSFEGIVSLHNMYIYINDVFVNRNGRAVFYLTLIFWYVVTNVRYYVGVHACDT